MPEPESTEPTQEQLIDGLTDEPDEIEDDVIPDDPDEIEEPEDEPDEDGYEDVEDAADEPEESDEPTPSQQHNFDKATQKLQQRLAALERKLEESGQEPTREQKQEAAALKDELDDLMNPDEVDPYKGTATLAKRLKDAEAKFAERERMYQGQLDVLNRSMREQQYRAAEVEFDRRNPDLAGKFNDVVADASNRLVDLARRHSIDLKSAAEDTVGLLWEMAQQQALDAAKPKSAAAPAPSKTPDKSTEGARVKPTTKTRSRPTKTSGEPTLQELINGLVESD